MGDGGVSVVDHGSVLPDSIAAVLVVVVAVLPGSVYTWAYERQASPYGVTLRDRTLRFITVSLFYHLILAWPEYAVYRVAIEGHGIPQPVRFAVFWAGLLVLVAIPGGIGTVLGGLYATRNTRHGWQWVRGWLSPRGEQLLLRMTLGRTPAPRAWDDLFSDRPNVYLRVRTVDGTWIAGRFARDSYAGGFPYQTDVLLEEAWSVDQETGRLGHSGLGYAVYVPAVWIAWMEVLPEQRAEPGEEEAIPDG